MTKTEVRIYLTEAQYYLISEIADEVGMEVNSYIKFLIAQRIEDFFITVKHSATKVQDQESSNQ